MNNLENFTEAELREELKKREEMAAEAERKERAERFRLLVENRETLLRFVPHGRTSCSDTDRANGFGSAEYGPRCTRCALLEVNEFDHEVYDFDLTLQFVPLNK